jgi:hypothetical protein
LVEIEENMGAKETKKAKNGISTEVDSTSDERNNEMNR